MPRVQQPGLLGPVEADDRGLLARRHRQTLGDAVGDVMDAYPDNPEASTEGDLDSPMGLIIILIVVTLLVLGGGSVLLIRFGGNNPAVTSGLVMDGLVQQVEGVGTELSEVQVNQPEQFVDENGNHWTRNSDGSMSWWNGTEWQQID